MSERRLVNAVEGGACYAGEPPRWYTNPRFRLVPLFHRKPGDRYNCSGFYFDWLGLSVWDISSPDIGAQVELDDQGLMFRIRVPFVIIQWKLPLFPTSWYQKLWRVKRYPYEPEAP